MIFMIGCNYHGIDLEHTPKGFKPSSVIDGHLLNLLWVDIPVELPFRRFRE